MAIVGRDMPYEEHLIGLKMTNTSSKKIILFAHVVLQDNKQPEWTRSYKFFLRLRMTFDL